MFLLPVVNTVSLQGDAAVTSGRGGGGADVHFLWRANLESGAASNQSNTAFPVQLYKEVVKCLFDAIYTVRLTAAGHRQSEMDPPAPYTRLGASQAEAALAWVDSCRGDVSTGHATHRSLASGYCLGAKKCNSVHVLGAVFVEIRSL